MCRQVRFAETALNLRLLFQIHRRAVPRRKPARPRNDPAILRECIG